MIAILLYSVASVASVSDPLFIYQNCIRKEAAYLEKSGESASDVAEATSSSCQKELFKVIDRELKSARDLPMSKLAQEVANKDDIDKEELKFKFETLKRTKAFGREEALATVVRIRAEKKVQYNAPNH